MHSCESRSMLSEIASRISDPLPLMLIAFVTFCYAPLSIEVAIGQDGVNLTVQTPAEGSPPRPTEPQQDQPAAIDPPAIDSAAAVQDDVATTESSATSDPSTKSTTSPVLDTQAATAATQSAGDASDLDSLESDLTELESAVASSLLEAETGDAVAEAISETEADSSVESTATVTLAVAEATTTDPADSDDSTDTQAETADASALAEVTQTVESPNLFKDDVRRLSVEPGTHPLLPADRPAWVGAVPDLSGEVHRLYVESIPVANRDKVDEALDERLVATVNNYAEQEVLKQPGAARDLGLTAEYIRLNLINDPDGYVAEIMTSDGPMYQKWVTLEVTPTQRQLIGKWHQAATQRQRLSQLGIGLVAVFGIVGLFHLVIRQRNVPPTSQPFRQEAANAAPQAAQETRRPRSGISFFTATLGVLLLPAMLFAALAVPVIVIKRQAPISHEVYAPQHHPAPPSPPKPPRVISEQESAHFGDALHGTGNVMKIKTGNQEVIIIRK